MYILLTQILGWTGTALIVWAYFLISSKKVDSDNRMYQFMNLFGAIAIGVHVLNQKAWAALTLEVIWAIIAIFSLIKNKAKA
jgi:hypothetical protein